MFEKMYPTNFFLSYSFIITFLLFKIFFSYGKHMFDFTPKGI